MKRGFAALSTVLILASVVVSIALTVSLLSIGEAQSGLALFKGEDNLSLVEGCVEDVMLKVRADQNYNANGATITRPEGTCLISVNSGLGGPVNWDLTVTSQSLDYQRQVRIIFTRNPTGITLNSWKEIN
ncbi:MAG: hypothetical protein UU73_C0003G0014 [Candidatus Daviesbacteria bacterium GW2011_GWA1_41_61]|uniref:Type 4 fimbrial biogenesis protein PilX N-terminal domain-containing protein n=1 Tax=Candidatus Daviesbacteria bacterium GW2011_GWA2_40_9 TaxID=1618424 RepID=A0A0G0TZ62_9BACT|nr:MAG: hypothetical protein UU26_C0005G0041 [Candidatus Daviesbacteria bacterium GW2011_GWC1_40_9]KKR82174.1 MAG: hypothetical protein UU29_C0017G0010 [Candidatus Daviesbacteria bacterium GW2011_GWA2_40_9]KKR93634.1 MAG: hypothetical protein UU44_C0002G0295 [Candidatus Daviesbacteria bacterium GW2011_GWB1_41_15]KKS14815.1 MAG: hypothetical protein UU73_C0003G0014 [Candidatus Daviesbacteria bacterium GW2011_GWA1_41_61]